MKQQLKLFQLFLFFVLFLTLNADVVDLSKADKNGNTLSSQTCNQQTIINFSFSSQSLLKSCPSCAITSQSKSSIQFLNIVGTTVNYPLTQASMETGDLTTQARGTGSFRFNFGDGTKQIIVIVPYRTAASSPQAAYQLDVSSSKLSDVDFNTLKSLSNQATTGSGLALSAFNFLNLLNYGLFYQVTIDSIGTKTILISYWVYIIPNLDTTHQYGTPYTSLTIPATAYSLTAQKLCYGSSDAGIFQTHMRQSYVLWVAYFSIFIFWLYALLADEVSLDCYNKNFDNNRWTCWGFYSLHFLAHEQYFTVLSRTSILFVNFSWQSLCLACIYNGQGVNANTSIIIWSAIIAVFASMPVSYFLGYVFMSRIYQQTLHKFDVMKKLKNVFEKKEGIQAYEKDIDQTEERLYGLYYWFYVFVFVTYVICFVVGIHEMQMLPRQNYYLLQYWLASLGITFVLDNLVFDPLLAFLLGNTAFYRIRGFYYDFRLGQRFKEAELQ